LFCDAQVGIPKPVPSEATPASTKSAAAAAKAKSKKEASQAFFDTIHQRITAASASTATAASSFGDDCGDVDDHNALQLATAMSASLQVSDEVATPAMDPIMTRLSQVTGCCVRHVT
jgi:hypothetical protein